MAKSPAKVNEASLCGMLTHHIMDIWGNFSVERMVRYWNRPPSLEILKKCEAVALGNSAGLMAGLGDFGGIFQP